MVSFLVFFLVVSRVVFSCLIGLILVMWMNMFMICLLMICGM